MRLILFYSETCRTCKNQIKEFEETKPLLEVEKMECSSSDIPDLMKKYNVTDVPTTILISDEGALLYRWVDFVRTRMVNFVIEAER